MNFLPGWFPAAVAASGAAAPLTELDFLTSASVADSTTITGPATIQAGDLLVISDVVYLKSGTPTSVVPADFTAAQNFTGVNGRLILSYKIATGAEASASITGMTMNGTTLFGSKIMFVFRGNTPITTASDASGGAEGTTGNPAAQNVAASGGTPPLVILAAYATRGAIDPRTFSPAKDGELQRTAINSVDHWLAYRIYETAPANTSIDMDDEGGNNILVSRYIQVA